MNVKTLCCLSLAALALPAFAQDGGSQVTINVEESQEYGAYLTDAEGNPLYLFVNEEMEAQESEDRMTEGVREAAAPCMDACLQAWPPVTAGEVQAGEGVDEELLYSAEIDGRMQAVYNGWPLYRFARDADQSGQAREAGDQIAGQGMGQEPNYWYIVSPEGEKIESEA